MGDETVLQLQDVDEEIPPQIEGPNVSRNRNGDSRVRVGFPKKGQDLELVCDSLAYKGNGVCKVVETGFIVLCERALPGERLIARIIKRKHGFAQVFSRSLAS